MALGHGFVKKLNRVAAAVLAAVIIAGTVCVPVKAESSVDGRVMGLDDYLNGTPGVDYFGYEINLADDEVERMKETKAILDELIAAARSHWVGADAMVTAWVIDSSQLSDATKARIQEKRGWFGSVSKSITLYSTGLTSGFITVKIDSDIDDSQFNNIKNRREVLSGNIINQEKRADGLRTIYRGFAVIGNVKNPANPTGSSFEVGDLKSSTFLDPLLKKLENNLYTKNNNYDKAIDDSSEPGKFEKMIAEPIANGAFDLYLWLANWNVDLTMDGLIFGRVSPSYKGSVDFTHYGLEENNPYGIVSATAYYVLRRILLGVLPVIFMAMLLRQLFSNGQKGRARLKECAANFLLAIVLAFVAPYVIEICIVVRDGILKYVSLGMSAILSSPSVGLGGGVGSNVAGLVYVTYKRNPSLLNALVWAASVGAGFVYLVSYIQIALLLTGAVAVLPIVLFVSIWNPKIIKDWWNVFFPNLCVPIVDMILLQVPSIFLLLFKAKYKNGNNFGGSAIILGILIIILMWNSLMIRDRVIRLLGFEGFARRGGGAIAAAAMMMARAARNVARGGRGQGDGRDNENGSDDKSGDRSVNSERSELQKEALKNIGGSDVPGEDEGRSFDPNLGNSTEDFLNGLDEQYGVNGTGFPDEGGETPDGEPAADGFDGAGDGEMADGEVPEDAMAEEGMPEGGVELGEVPEGGVPEEGMPEGGADLGEVPGGDEVPEGDGIPADGIRDGGVPGEGIAAMDGEVPGGVRAAAEGVSGETPRVTDRVPGDAEGDRITGRAEDFRQNSKYPSREAITEDVDGELEKAFHPIERTRSDGTKEYDYGKYGDLVSGDFHKNVLTTDAEKGRYENLVRMDAYNAKIKENEAAMKGAGYSRDTYEKDRAAFMGQEERLNSHINASRDRLNAMGDQNSDAYRAERASCVEMLQKKAQLHERVEQLDRAAGLDRANVRYRDEVSRMTQTEGSYAKAWKVGGMSDRTYQTAKDFEYQKKIDNAQKNLANYRNFDSKKYEGILTPAEREDFYREREVRERRERTVRALATGANIASGIAVGAASYGAGIAGATLSAYGGGRSQADLYLLGRGAVRVAGDRVTGYAGNAGRAVGNAYVEAPIRRSSDGSAAPVQNQSGGVNYASPDYMSRRASEGERNREERPKKTPVNTGTGSASPKQMGRLADEGDRRRNGNSGNRAGSGSASPKQMSDLARQGDRDGRERRKGTGNASPRQMGDLAEQGNKDGRGHGPNKGKGSASPKQMGDLAEQGNKVKNPENKGKNADGGDNK
ncbi:MAG: hypothetical protein IKO41_07795 [Lachnospiraceae bacterium]|nr:hypothetical protein [Lachnospiraceae bacterium]